MKISLYLIFLKTGKKNLSSGKSIYLILFFILNRPYSFTLFRMRIQFFPLGFIHFKTFDYVFL